MVVGGETHDSFEQSAVVPTPIENDDLSRSGKMHEISLDLDLKSFKFRRSGEGGHSKHPRADPLGDMLDHTTFFHQRGALRTI
jgi:hypothetical protein